MGDRIFILISCIFCFMAGVCMEKLTRWYYDRRAKAIKREQRHQHYLKCKAKKNFPGIIKMVGDKISAGFGATDEEKQF